jgi:tRNA threonylcarbamoyladenosine biosynthesis protein TsaE
MRPAIRAWPKQGAAGYRTFVDPRIELCGPEAAGIVHRLTQEAFAGYDELDPPSMATRETQDRVRADLEAHGGAVAWLDGRPVGCLRFEASSRRFFVRRVAVRPALQGRGIGRALMSWADVEAARRELALAVGVHVALPGNVAFYRGLGYRVVAEHADAGHGRTTWLEMRKATRRTPA